MKKLLEFVDREIYWVPAAPGLPAVYYIRDHKAGGVLVNTPEFSPALVRELQTFGPLNYIFLPSRFGAGDLGAWRAATGAESMAFETEVSAIKGTVDIALEPKSKLTRTIDFLPMAGRTQGSCALRLKNLPGAVFFGPILEPSPAGWPTLVPHADDYSYETRLLGALGLQDVKFEYAFTDVFDAGRTRYGPGAGNAIRAEIERVLGLT